MRKLIIAVTAAAFTAAAVATGAAGIAHASTAHAAALAGPGGGCPSCWHL
jgi:hypothetical protein